MTPRRAPQARAEASRGKIITGAITVLAKGGVAALTHRALAEAAGVSLASTTYHFDTKASILEAASRDLMERYLGDFERVSERLAQGAAPHIPSLAALGRRVTLNALGPARDRSLAWCEIMLHGGRSPEGRALAESWYIRLTEIWARIAAQLGEPAESLEAVLDREVGLTFLLHPLALTPDAAEAAVSGGASLSELLQMPALPAPAPIPADSPRGRILQAAIAILGEDGAAALSHRSVASRCGMVRSGPSYHFPSIDELLKTAEHHLADRARQRYRAGFGALGEAPLDAARLADLTTTIFLREALEFPGESLGALSAWVNAARAPEPSPAITAHILEVNRGWERRLRALGAPAPGIALSALHLQAAFIGRLVRVLCCGRDIARLTGLRDGFAADLRAAAI